MSSLPDFMKPGFEENLGSHTFTPEEIIRFAEKFDPQPFHLSEEAASKSLFGGLCASGWHTVSVWMRKRRDAAAKHASTASQNDIDMPSGGISPGFSDLKWLKPVMAGDTITYYSKTVTCRKSRSRPGWYVLESENRGENQKDEIVIIFRGSALLKFPA